MRPTPFPRQVLMRCRCCIACALIAASANVACRQTSAPGRPHAREKSRAVPATPPVSPEETVGLMRKLHADRDYESLGEYVTVASRSAFVDTLMAMDDFLAANASLQSAVHESMDARLAPLWDLSPWADAMGLFAPQVKVITADDDGKTALIRYQIADRVPLEDVKLHWVNDRWMYDPGEALPGLAPAIRELSMTLNSLAQKVRRRPMSRDDLDAEFRLRVIPRLNRVLAAAATQPAEPEKPAPTTAPSNSPMW